jgi:putative ABC transport system ATP-binding protein
MPKKIITTAFEFLIDDDLEQAFHYFERAESKLKIVNNIPLLNQTRIGLSICYYKSNKFKEGKKELRQVAFIQLDNMLWHIKGDLFYLMGFFKDSETVYKEIIQSFPDDIVAYQKLKGLYVDSLQSDRKLKRLQEQYAKHFNHGLILANLICFACHFKSIINIVCASNFFPCDSDSIVFLVISIHNLAFSYNEKSSIVFPDWKVDDRNPALIMGESGSGKTTLLQLMGGLLPVQKGSLVVDQIELASLRSRKLKAYRADHVGFVFQGAHLIQALNVAQNIRLSTMFSQLPNGMIPITELLEKLNLSDQRNKSINALSTGQQQRVAIARALVHKPAVILADEPTSSLDDRHCEQVIDLLLETCASCSAQLIVTTHDRRIKSHFSHQLTIPTK